MLAALEGKMPAIARVDCKQGIYQGGELEKEDKNSGSFRIPESSCHHWNLCLGLAEALSALGPQGCSQGTDDTDCNTGPAPPVCTHGSSLTSGWADMGVDKARAGRQLSQCVKFPLLRIGCKRLIRNLKGFLIILCISRIVVYLLYG